jgi:hypothetical protein
LEDVGVSFLVEDLGISCLAATSVYALSKA